MVGEAQAERDAAAAELASTAAGAALAVTAAAADASTEAQPGGGWIGGKGPSEWAGAASGHSAGVEAATAAGLPALLLAASEAVGKRVSSLSTAIAATSGLAASAARQAPPPGPPDAAAVIFPAAAASSLVPAAAGGSSGGGSPSVTIQGAAGAECPAAAPGGGALGTVQVESLPAEGQPSRPAAARKLVFAAGRAATVPVDNAAAGATEISQPAEALPPGSLSVAGQPAAAQQQSGAKEGPGAAAVSAALLQAPASAGAAAAGSALGGSNWEGEGVLAAASAAVDGAIIRPLVAQHACISRACRGCARPHSRVPLRLLLRRDLSLV